jgi:predicted nucleic acid-binding protein
MIDLLRGSPQAAALVDGLEDRVILSAMVVAELYGGVRDGKERADLADGVSFFPIIPVTAELARVGGLLKRDYGRSHGIGLVDALLAAAARQEGADLQTLNVKHYPMVAGLEPAYLKTDRLATE